MAPARSAARLARRAPLHAQPGASVSIHSKLQRSMARRASFLPTKPKTAAWSRKQCSASGSFSASYLPSKTLRAAHAHRARSSARHAQAPQKQNEERGQQKLAAAQEDFCRRQEDFGLKGPASKEESECRDQRQEEECVHTNGPASEEKDEVEAAQRSPCRLKEAGGSSSVSAFPRWVATS